MHPYFKGSRAQTTLGLLYNSKKQKRTTTWGENKCEVLLNVGESVTDCSRINQKQSNQRGNEHLSVRQFVPDGAPTLFCLLVPGDDLWRGEPHRGGALGLPGKCYFTNTVVKMSAIGILRFSEVSVSFKNAFILSKIIQRYLKFIAMCNSAIFLQLLLERLE